MSTAKTQDTLTSLVGSEVPANETPLEMTLLRLLTQSSPDEEMDLGNGVIDSLDLPALLHEEEQDAFINNSMKNTYNAQPGQEEHEIKKHDQHAQSQEEKHATEEEMMMLMMMPNQTETAVTAHNKLDLDEIFKEQTGVRYEKSKTVNKNIDDSMLFHTLTPPSSTNSPFTSDSDELSKLHHMEQFTSSILMETDHLLDLKSPLGDDSAASNTSGSKKKNNKTSKVAKKPRKTTYKKKNNDISVLSDKTNSELGITDNKIATSTVDIGGKPSKNKSIGRNIGSSDAETKQIINKLQTQNDKSTIQIQQLNAKLELLQAELNKVKSERQELSTNYGTLRDDHVKNCLGFKKLLLKFRDSELNRVKIAYENKVLRQKVMKMAHFKNKKLNSLMPIALVQQDTTHNLSDIVQSEKLLSVNEDSILESEAKHIATQIEAPVEIPTEVSIEAPVENSTKTVIKPLVGTKIEKNVEFSDSAPAKVSVEC